MIHTVPDAYHYLSHVMRKPVYVICEQQRHRSACAEAQADQRLYCSLLGQYNTLSLYIRNFKPVPCFFGCAGRFESYLIGNLEDRFSRDVTHFILGGGGGGGGIDLGNPCNNDGECQAGGGGANSECSTNCICSTGYADNAGSCDRGNNIMHIYFRTNRFKY